jgi:hypothetical protein
MYINFLGEKQGSFWSICFHFCAKLSIQILHSCYVDIFKTENIFLSQADIKNV